MQQIESQVASDWPALLRVGHVAWMLQLSSGHVEELIRDGVLPVVQIGHSQRVPRQQLIEWVNALAAQAALPESQSEGTDGPAAHSESADGQDD